MKKIFALALALMMVLSLAACGGGKDPAPSGSGTADPGTQQTDPGNSEVTTPPEDETEPSAEIDLSQFTAVEVPDWEILEDWMVPTGGVLTEADEMMGLYFLTVSGITMAEVESYEQVLVDNGLTAHTGNISTHIFDNDQVEIFLDLQAVETTKESVLRITIEKP